MALWPLDLDLICSAVRRPSLLRLTTLLGHTVVVMNGDTICHLAQNKARPRTARQAETKLAEKNVSYGFVDAHVRACPSSAAGGWRAWLSHDLADGKILAVACA